MKEKKKDLSTVRILRQNIKLYQERLEEAIQERRSAEIELTVSRSQKDMLERKLALAEAEAKYRGRMAAERELDRAAMERVLEKVLHDRRRFALLEHVAQLPEDLRYIAQMEPPC